MHISEITSLQNPRIKEVVKLRQERQRKKQKKILIDGLREIQRAFDAGFQMEELYVCDDAEIAAARQFGNEQTQLYKVSDSAFAKMAYGNRNEGVIAVATEKVLELSELKLSELPFFLVLDGIEKPGNIGAVFRSASAAGVDAILLSNEISHPFNANAIRASLGTVFEVPFVCAGTEQLTSYLNEKGIQIVTTLVDSEVAYTNFDYNQPLALVMGSEAEGVVDQWTTFDSITIPMKRSVDSLNISVSAAIVMFEVVRQRQSR